MSSDEIQWETFLGKEPETTILMLSIRLLRTDRYWEKIPMLVDNCPSPTMIQYLAMAHFRCESGSQFFRKTFHKLQELLLTSLQCQDEVKRDLYLTQILIQWGAWWHQSVMETVFNCEQFGHLSHNLEEYKSVVDLIYHLLPQECISYFNSAEGQHFWRGIKRLQSVGFVSAGSVEVVEDIIIRKIGLPMITFDPVDLNSIMGKFGFKKMAPAPVDDFDVTQIVDILKVSDMCYLTDPCQHDVTVLLKDGRQLTHLMTYPDIVEVCTRIGKQMHIH
jgi:hypothetical protein